MVEHVSRMFFDRPCFITPSGWGRLLNLVIFGFLPVTGAHVFVGVGVWCVFGWVLGFSRPVSAETFFVESLILAQDERWRRA